ncbi:MAG: radical SAM family heme chaperone HemW [Nitrospirota bacterium]|nr:MAG: radical SAM family heme chaperone HemW [Nitrospirota bacterium]
MKNFYIHVPFCQSKCQYCDFYSIVTTGSIVDDYIDAVGKELISYNDLIDTADTVYIGGGTPTVLNEDDIGNFLKTITDHIQIDIHTEFTIEANPGTLNSEKIGIMKDHGINRISLGVQSLNDKMLSFLGRSHNAQQAEDALRLIAANFTNYSVDIIYGIPAQDRSVMTDTLESVFEYEPPHISAYELTPEGGTPLFEDIEAAMITMPDEESVLELYNLCESILTERGYIHYEISNYGKKGYEARHNMNYWKRGEYRGIGPSAHSFAGKKRQRNVQDVHEYCSILSENTSPVDEVIELTSEDELREVVFLGLRTSAGIVLEQFIERLSPDEVVNALHSSINEGLIKVDGSRLSLTSKGMPLSNTLTLEVMRSLRL